MRGEDVLRVLHEGDVVDVLGAGTYLIRRASWSLLLFRMLQLGSQFVVEELAHAVFRTSLFAEERVEGVVPLVWPRRWSWSHAVLLGWPERLIW